MLKFETQISSLKQDTEFMILCLEQTFKNV